MKIPRWAKNKVHGLMLRHGPEAIRRSIWNREYAAGRWKCLDSMPNDCVLPYLNGHSKGGRILDIGCGPGAIGEAIDPLAYRHYFGVDISDVAIEKARARNSRLNNVYTVGDMWTFNPTDTYDLIFFGDSLYNFSVSNGKKILNRYSAYLNEGGVFVIRTWVSLGRARAVIELIESDYEVIEKRSFAFQSPLIVIVFKPKILVRSSPSRAARARVTQQMIDPAATTKPREDLWIHAGHAESGTESVMKSD